ncbi:TadE family type IV pilus minor pilin [Saccharothrix sp. NRRL B-16348]|uniref:TadE family type IV pilus minor pilin n=1 Tax=Saccharothrix sp. NRRL B-16348 TaxID=1415542 RepID=UPI0006ADA9D8|nr:TadE family type IV pilus minor pilin [Saccharothrix sp. NRRL B-16348]
MKRAVLGDDRGGVTVEAAVAVCGLVAVLVLGVSAVMAVVAQLRCTDAAREAARLVARGDPGRVDGVVGEIAPEGARWAVRREGDTASVEVAVSRLGIELRARAYAVVEPGVVDG